MQSAAVISWWPLKAHEFERSEVTDYIWHQDVVKPPAGTQTSITNQLPLRLPGASEVWLLFFWNPVSLPGGPIPHLSSALTAVLLTVHLRRSHVQSLTCAMWGNPTQCYTLAPLRCLAGTLQLKSRRCHKAVKDKCFRNKQPVIPFFNFFKMSSLSDRTESKLQQWLL